MTGPCGVEFGGIVLAPGVGRGAVRRLTEPLSFWGGYDAETGTVIDRRHPQLGASLAGTVLVMPAGRGSGSSSSVLCEAIRRGTAPAAIILRDTDLILTVGSCVAAELYGRRVPVVVATAAEFDRLLDGEVVLVEGADAARITPLLDGGTPV